LSIVPTLPRLLAVLPEHDLEGCNELVEEEWEAESD